LAFKYVKKKKEKFQYLHNEKCRKKIQKFCIWRQYDWRHAIVRRRMRIFLFFFNYSNVESNYLN